MDNKAVAKTLNSLIETARDGQEGFRLAAQDTTAVEVKSLCNEFALQRAKFAGELQELVRGLGQEYETDSSVTGALHRGWINLKSALTSKDDHAILAECERGEDSAVSSFREALQEKELPDHIRAIVQTQASAVKAAHDRVRALRDAYETAKA